MDENRFTQVDRLAPNLETPYGGLANLLHVLSLDSRRFGVRIRGAWSHVRATDKHSGAVEERILPERLGTRVVPDNVPALFFLATSAQAASIPAFGWTLGRDVDPGGLYFTFLLWDVHSPVPRCFPDGCSHATRVSPIEALAAGILFMRRGDDGMYYTAGRDRCYPYTCIDYTVVVSRYTLPAVSGATDLAGHVQERASWTKPWDEW